MREIAETQKLPAATGIIYGLTSGCYVNHHFRLEFVSRYAGYKAQQHVEWPEALENS